jgi:hypothetical protein
MGMAARRPRADETTMAALAAIDQVRPLRPQETARIRGGCGHAFVPPAPAAWGYRYYDLGGELPPFYLRRFALRSRTASVALTAPVERLSGDDAERGAVALARVEITVGARTVPWIALLDEVARDRDARELLEHVLDEVVCLDLVPARDCPICGP